MPTMIEKAAEITFIINPHFSSLWAFDVIWLVNKLYNAVFILFYFVLFHCVRVFLFLVATPKKNTQKKQYLMLLSNHFEKKKQSYNKRENDKKKLKTCINSHSKNRSNKKEKKI